MLIGCHLSSSGGYLAMAQTAVSIGANVFQFFTRNPRGGAAKPVDPADVEAFIAYAREHGVGPILAHAPYTLNAAGAEERVREFAEATMADDLKRLELTPGAMYNFHPGSHVGQGAEAGIELVSSMLARILLSWREAHGGKFPATSILFGQGQRTRPELRGDPRAHRRDRVQARDRRTNTSRRLPRHLPCLGRRLRHRRRPRRRRRRVRPRGGP